MLVGSAFKNSLLVKLLACSECKGRLSKRGMFIVCTRCKLAYPVIEGVVDMLVQNAWPLEKAEQNRFRHELKLVSENEKRIMLSR